MLEPQSRAALTDMLHPPSGFTLAHAVGTTYTLDLDTALTIPLSFAAKRVTSDDSQLAILDAVRRATDRVDIFAQAGQLSINYPASDLVAFLEPMVHPVAVGRGIFHPKVWFLEYERGDERAYRFICASRNLTADRSWDVVISLDGEPAGPDTREAAAITNEPLVQLLKWLPGHTVSPLHASRRTRIDELAQRWQDIEWTTPPDMRDLQFHVWVVGDRPAPEFWGIRGLFVSPFLTDEGITEIKEGVYGDACLVSRENSINALDCRTFDRRLRRTYVLDEAANPDATLGDEAAETAEEGAIGPPMLSGLHAKTYIFDRADGAHVLLGSLNATTPALHANVEVMVEVVGSVNKFGVERTLDGLGDLVQEFEYTGEVEDDEDELADRDLRDLLGRIARIPLHARVVTGDPYSLEVWRAGEASVPPDVEVTWRPITRRDLAVRGLPGPATASTVLHKLTLVEVTPFVVITARDSRGERSEQSTIMVAELHDDPADRRDAVIAAHLTDPEAFLRFLMLLLDISGVSLGRAAEGSWGALGSSGSGAGLFEALLRAVGPDRAGLADVERVVRYLSNQSGGSEVLPQGFNELWEAVWAAHQALTGSGHG